MADITFGGIVDGAIVGKPDSCELGLGSIVGCCNTGGRGRRSACGMRGSVGSNDAEAVGGSSSPAAVGVAAGGVSGRASLPARMTRCIMRRWPWSLFYCGGGSYSVFIAGSPKPTPKDGVEETRLRALTACYLNQAAPCSPPSFWCQLCLAGAALTVDTILTAIQK